MVETLILILTFLAGMVLGGLFFGGLWWTVQKGVSSPRPGLWFFVSLVLRTSTVLIGFYFIAADHWQRLLLCLLGFVLARMIMTYFTRIEGKSTCLTKESRHAPES